MRIGPRVGDSALSLGVGVGVGVGVAGEGSKGLHRSMGVLVQLLLHPLVLTLCLVELPLVLQFAFYQLLLNLAIDESRTTRVRCAFCGAGCIDSFATLLLGGRG